MPQGDRWADEPSADLAARRDAIRQAAGIAGADARELLDAALTKDSTVPLTRSPPGTPP